MKPVHLLSRRRFLGSVPVAAGASVAALESAAAQSGGAVFGKSGLRILSERPVNAETLVTDLDPRYTPNDKHFVRNNGGLPERALSGSLEGWSLRIDGEVGTALELSRSTRSSRASKTSPGPSSSSARETEEQPSSRERRATSGGSAPWVARGTRGSVSAMCSPPRGCSTRPSTSPTTVRIRI